MPAFAARARIAEWILIGLGLVMLAILVGTLIAGWEDELFRARVFVRTMKLLVPVGVLLALPKLRGALFNFLGERTDTAGDTRTAMAIWGLFAAASVIALVLIGYDFYKVLSY